LPLDVTDINSVKAMVDDTVKRYGTIDVLLNNAAVFPMGSVEDATEAIGKTAALLSKTSIVPYLLTVSSTIAFTEFISVTSSGKKLDVHPTLVIRSTVSCPAISFISATTTEDPSLANRWHAALPIPEPPPVIIETFPCNLIFSPLSITFPNTIINCGA
jgi:hypothetical protein